MEFSNITLVTGATGFIGRHLVKRLADAGVKVRATGLSTGDRSFFAELGVEFIPSDLTVPATLPPLFQGDVDRVFHLGAICNFSTSYKNLYPINVKGVEYITKLAMAKGIKRFVHVCSTSVYGPYRGKPFNEESPRCPQDNYGRSKRDGEDVVFGQMNKGLPVTILRPSTVYGPGCNDGAGKVFSGPSSITGIPGHGKQRLSNVRAEDVAGAAVFLSQLDEAQNQIYNISDDSNPMLEEALALAAETFGTRVPRSHIPLALVKTFACIDGFISGLRGKIPVLEYDAVRYLGDDYIVDSAKLKQTGYQLLYPDFKTSIRQQGKSQV
ncbi:MAG: NAD-dependent epimerase/dehydratase family protein [Chitinophagales bacterium]